MEETVIVAVTSAARAAGVDPGTLLRIAEIESSGDPSARSPGSKYMGLFQLSQEEFTANGGGDIFNAADNARAAARKLKTESDRWRAKYGRAPTAFDIYMVHQQGWSGFKALTDKPNALAWVAIRQFYSTDAVAKAAIAGNCPAAWGDAIALTAAQFLGAWRGRIEPPAWLRLARGELGTREVAGNTDNPRVVAYYADAGHAEVKDDETAWCAAFVGAMLKRSGLTPSGSLMARSYLKWGMDAGAPRAGCVAVLWRGSPDAATGHVGFVVAWSSTHVVLLGGNQSNGVTEARYPRDQVLGWRWPVEVKQVEDKEDMTEDIRKYVEAFASLTPTLARAAGSPFGGVVAQIVVDVLKRSGKPEGDEAPAATLNRIGVVESIPILREAEAVLSALGMLTAPAPVPALASASTPSSTSTTTSTTTTSTPEPTMSTSTSTTTTTPTSTPEQAMTPFDSLFGGALMGWKTYIVIALATILNGAAVLGLAPAFLTPDVVAAGNTGLAGLGGAALVSKVERYVRLGAGLIRK
jgi:uncharacterized protein (TIGR02594 family)